MATMTTTVPTETTKISEEREPSARLSCRISPAIKRRAEEAASLLGQSITDFTEAALSEKAQTVFEQHERIVLSARDFERFVAAIQAEPEPPSPQLRAAVEEYKARHEATAGRATKGDEQ